MFDMDGASNNCLTSVSSWYDFVVDDLFELLPVKHKLSKVDLSDTGHSVYSSETSNNGVLGFYDGSPEFVVDMLRPVYVVFGDHTCSMNIVTDSFSVMDNVKVLLPRRGNVLSMLFVTTVWKKVIPYLGYARHWSVAKDCVVKLPVTPDVEPDWDYMEQYMKSVMDRQAHVIDFLTRISKEKHSVDVGAWGEFRVGDLFDVQRGQRHVLHNHESGDIPYYSASLVNNGVTDLIGNPLFVANDAIVVTTFGDAFWADGNFTASDECSILTHSNMNELSGLFVATAYMAHNKRKYSFKLKAFSGRVADDVVFLPVIPGGEPDWSYMEQYMRAVMDRQEHVVRCLARLRG